MKSADLSIVFFQKNIVLWRIFVSRYIFLPQNYIFFLKWEENGKKYVLFFSQNV